MDMNRKITMPVTLNERVDSALRARLTVTEKMKIRHNEGKIVFLDHEWFFIDMKKGDSHAKD